jgi:hypothetical protein
MMSNNFNSFQKSPLLAFIKSEPTFLTDSLAVCLSAPVQGDADGRGVWEEFRPPSQTFLFQTGGGRGIRTPVTITREAVFKTAAFSHSAIPPQQ